MTLRLYTVKTITTINQGDDRPPYRLPAPVFLVKRRGAKRTYCRTNSVTAARTLRTLLNRELRKAAKRGRR